MEGLISFSITAKPVIVIIHALAGAIGIGTTTVTDYFFFQFLKDLKITPREASTLSLLSRILWTALFVLIVTGCLLFLSDIARYGSSTKFLIKCVIVLGIAINGYVLHRIVTPGLVHLDFDTRIHRQKHVLLKRVAFACGGISVFSWYAAFILGMIPKIPLPFWVLLVGYGILLCGIVIVAQAMYWFYHRKGESSI